jgi:hypothetical protein
MNAARTRMLGIVPLLAVPAWVWATLLMAGFVALSVITIALVRIAVRQRPSREDKQRDPIDR